jgi:UDP-glucose 4-epimerase
MKILIAGSAGHIGSALIKALPHFFDNLCLVLIDGTLNQNNARVLDLPERVPYSIVDGKIQDLDLDIIFAEVDVVVHLAATINFSDAKTAYENNFSATKLIAQACLKNNVPLLFPSTASVYQAQNLLVDEQHTVLHAQSPYVACKIKEEELLLTLAKNQRLPVTICRFGTIYGPSVGMNTHTAVSKFCWQAVTRQPITVWETALDQKRPYLFLDDAVNAMAWIIKQRLFNGQIYNVVTGNHTVRDVLTVIGEALQDVQITYVQDVLMNQLSYEVSSQKLQKTGFKFNGPLEKGIRETIFFLKKRYNHNEA